ncbi:MAG: type IV secretory system conjugative DNA transfer family protein [Methylobacterium organophilum]|nr:type IV secretory system conjugative DNA transfer family protein [Methylobacterium organophilum]
MVSRAAYDLGRTVLKIAFQLWPLWLFWFALHLGSDLWRDHVLVPWANKPNSTAYLLLYRAWPSVGLAGPIALMLAALAAERAQLGSRAMAVAGIVGVAIATGLTLWPEWARLSPHLDHAAPLALLDAVDVGMGVALCVGVLASAAGVRILRGDRLNNAARPVLTRAPSDNHGHADWLDMKSARALFPGPDPIHGGIVVGEAYRVDQDRAVRGPRGISLPVDPADRRTWGQGGSAPLLVDPCRTGPTHALVLAGSGGFKTTSVGVPTLLAWTASAVVLDPSREIGPMVSAVRARELGHKVVTLDPSDPDTGSFNVLDWIDTADPGAESNVEAVATWLAGEPGRGAKEGGAEFFRDMGKSLVTCVLADVLWDADEAAERTLRRVRKILVTPEGELREQLKRIHAHSGSHLARDLAGTLMELVPETFSGVYANANKATRWLSTRAYADLVSGGSFRTADLCAGDLTVFVQIPLKVLQSTPGLGRVVIGALLNAAYEADGRVKGRILFLLDEVARLGPMGVIEAARDAGRKYGLTLLLLYQSVGQLVEQWGREGARAWYDSTSWRLYAAVQDPETAKELSQVCGEHGVVTTSRGDTAGTSARGLGSSQTNSGRSENRSEMRRALIKPDELLQDTRADEAFVIVRGSRPIRCGRAIFFRRPDMAARVAPSRFHAGRPSEAAE